MAKKLSNRAVNQKMEKFTDWREEFNTIERDFEFDDFTSAMAFVNDVAEIAENENHHPDIIIHNYNNVKIMLTTHSANGLTEKDFTVAKEINNLL